MCIYIYNHNLPTNLLNSSSSYLMSMLCKLSTNKFMIMVKKCYRQDYEKCDKT